MKMESWTSFRTLLKREVARIFQLWLQTLLPPVITAALYFIIFGHFMGARIGKIAQFDYVQYLAPGVIMLWIINASYNSVTGSLFIARFQRSIEEILVAPITNRMLLAGFLSGGIVRGVLVGLLVTITATFFTHLTVVHLGATCLVVFLSSLLFSLVGFINGLFARTFDDIMVVTTFILTPLTYLGGVFYSINMLPPLWQKISYFNPIIYIVDSFRYGILGITDINVWTSLGILVVCNISLYILCRVLLNKGYGIRN